MGGQAMKLPFVFVCGGVQTRVRDLLLFRLDIMKRVCSIMTRSGFGRRIRGLTEKEGWNQELLAKSMGVSRVTIARSEVGIHRNLALPTRK